MTISDIAKLAGVSSAAVSRYLNGGPLSEQKRAVIQAVVEHIILSTSKINPITHASLNTINYLY